jgi:hypothetical protein
MTKVVELCKIYKHLTLEDLQNEIWRDIEGYDGVYQISNLGRVQSFERKEEFRGSHRNRKGGVFNSCKKNGYRIALLRKNHQPKTFKISRLVALHFIPNPENKPFVNHIDGDKGNDFCTNLEWVTPSENSCHARDNGLRNPPNGSNHKNSKLNEGKVIEIRELLSSNISIPTIAKIFAVSKGTISDIKYKNTWAWLK